MIRIRFVRLLAFFVFLINNAIYAAEIAEPPQTIPSEPTHANWVFSGVVTNENGENYGYIFQIQRDGEQFRSIAALLDGQNKQVLFFDESDALIKEPTPYNWHVGRAFLRFNPINDSWIFGLKTKDKKGFNFKVDMLTQAATAPVAQDLRPGIELLVNQTGHLNGHIQMGNENKEQFVTAKNAWFRQIWLTAQQEKSHPFSGVLCRFNDGSGFYSVKMTEADALRGAVAGWCNEQGISAGISQFINVKQDPKGPWHINVVSPSLHLVLSDLLKQNTVVAGFIAEGKNPGFCMLSKDVIGGELS